MAAPPKQTDLRKKLAQKDEAIRKKLELELQKRRVLPSTQSQGTPRRINGLAAKGTLAALRPAPLLTVPETTTVADVCQLCAARRADCALIVDEDRLIGMVTSEDLAYHVVANGLDPRTTPVRQIMTLDPVASPESSSTAHGLELMISNNIRHLPIMNEEGKIVGVVDLIIVFYEILSHAQRKYSASEKLLNAMTGVEDALGTDGANSDLLIWVKSLRRKTALPDLPSIMSTRTQPVIVGPKMSVREVAQLMRDNNTTAVCIMDDPTSMSPGLARQVPRLSGIFTTKDIVLRVIASGLDAARCSVIRVMTPQPDKVRLTMSIYDAVKMMFNGSYLHLPVVEDDDRLIAVFDAHTLAEATQEQVKGANQEITVPEAAGPMWGRFFDSIGNKTPLSALPGGALLFSSPGDVGNQLPPPEPEVYHQSPNDDSISIDDDASVSLTGSIVQSPNGGSVNLQDSTTLSATTSPTVDPGYHVFKFRTPGGMNYRLLARQDDFNGLKALIAEKMATDPMFDADSVAATGIKPNPHDFKISYTDEDGDPVFIVTDRDVFDAVVVARKASSDRVMLTIHGGKSWIVVAGSSEQGKEKVPAALVIEPAPTIEAKPITPTPPPTASEPRRADIEPVQIQEAPPRYTPTYELETPASDLSQAYTTRNSPGISPKAASKLKETRRHSLEMDKLPPLRTAVEVHVDANESSSVIPRPVTLPVQSIPKSTFVADLKVPIESTEDKKRPEDKLVTDNVKGLIAHFTSVFSDAHQYKRILKTRGTDAQKLLDAFQTLLDIPGLSAAFRRNLLVGTQRLSKSAGLYPTCYNLGDIELIGKHPVAAGGFADIHKGRFFGQVVCLKIIRIYQTSEVQSFLKQFSSEAILWGQLSHANLLPIYGLYRYSGRLCLVAPWMDNGNIGEYLQHHPDVNRPLLVLDVASGISYLHGNDIVHGDLKGANILVNGSGRACLADFGISAVSDPSILHWSTHSLVGSKGGSIRWQAPELFDIEADEIVHNTKPSDVYAFACVAYEVFSGNIPFAELTRDSAVIIKVRSGSRPTRPHPLSPTWVSWGLNETFWSLMETCWSAQPEHRPNIHDIVTKHSFEGLSDDRPWDNDDILSPANFRDSVGARATLPSVTDVEAILNSVDTDDETPLKSSR